MVAFSCRPMQYTRFRMCNGLIVRSKVMGHQPRVAMQRHVAHARVQPRTPHAGTHLDISCVTPCVVEQRLASWVDIAAILPKPKPCLAGVVGSLKKRGPRVGAHRHWHRRQTAGPGSTSRQRPQSTRAKAGMMIPQHYSNREYNATVPARQRAVPSAARPVALFAASAHSLAMARKPHSCAAAGHKLLDRDAAHHRVCKCRSHCLRVSGKGGSDRGRVCRGRGCSRCGTGSLAGPRAAASSRRCW